MSTSYDLLIVNGIVVTASDTGAYDIAIKEEKIALLAPRGGLDGVESKKVIDAEGGWVMVCLEALSPPLRPYVALHVLPQLSFFSSYFCTRMELTFPAGRCRRSCPPRRTALVRQRPQLRYV